MVRALIFLLGLENHVGAHSMQKMVFSILVGVSRSNFFDRKGGARAPRSNHLFSISRSGIFRLG